MPKLPRNVWILTLTSYLTDVSSEMLFNLLPLFLANVLGVRTALIGVVEGVAETTSSTLKLLSGWLSDKLGTRKGLTVAGYGVSALAKPLLYGASSWLGVLLVRFADRVGKGVRTAPRDALIADSVDAGQRGLAFGLHRAGDTFGAFTGLGIALAVVLLMQPQTFTLARDTFQTLVIIASVPAVAAVAVLALGARDVRAKPPQNGAPPPSLSLRVPPGDFRRFLLLVVLFTLGNASDAFLILRAQERGLSVPGVLLLLMAFNAVYALLSGPAGALSDRIGRRRVLLFGWGAYALIYLGFALAGETWQVVALYVLYGVYYAFAEGTAKAFVADLVPAEARGTAYGVYNAAVGLAALPASLLAGVLWQGVGGGAGFGARAPFLFGAALAGAAALGFALALRPQKLQHA